MADENIREQHKSTPWMCGELDADTLNEQDKEGLETIFWALRGTGSKRDRFMRFSQFKKWLNYVKDVISEIQNNGLSKIQNEFSFVNPAGQHATVSADRITISNKRDETVVITCDGVTFENKDGVIFAIDSKGFLYNGEDYSYEVSDAGISIKKLNSGTTVSITKDGVSFRSELGRSLMAENLSTGKIFSSSVKTETLTSSEVTCNTLASPKVTCNSVDTVVLDSTNVTSTSVKAFSVWSDFTVPGIFTATSVEEFKNPSKIGGQLGVCPEGGMAVVKNGTNLDILVGEGTPSQGTNYASGFIVKPGEFVRYILVDGAWKHVW